MRVLVGLIALSGCAAPDPVVGAVDGIPIIPVAYDAYRSPDQLPRIRIGDRAYLRSTFDRAGGNEASDASHFIRQAADGTYVIVDVAGPGYLAFARANHWHGSPWHYTVDGIDHVVSESSTATPTMPVSGATFLPAHAFPPPLAVTWSTTRGADLSWVPIPFTSALQLAHERTHYGTGYYIVHTFPTGIDHLSAPLAAWAEEAPPDDVVQSLAATVPVPDGEDHVATVDIPAEGAITALELAGASTIRRLEIDAPLSAAHALARAHMTIHWDDRSEASVDAPLGLLFGAGTFYDREGRGELVRAWLARVSLADDRVRATLYFPMPFGARAQISLAGNGSAIEGVRIAVRTVANPSPMAWQGYFHASYRDLGAGSPGRDHVVLDTTLVEGGGEWCGTFNGMAFTFSDRAELTTLEGDLRAFLDDAESPQAHTTGTEEWAGGGDYWGGQQMTLALAGHPTGAPSAAAARDSEDAIQAAYRFLVADALPFGTNARIQLEHGGTNMADEHYRSVAFWYGRPGGCLVQTDALDVGDATDEAAHGYVSAGELFTATSTWDGLGLDAPASVQTGRRSTDGAAFTLAIDPRNRGVLLRRALDYAVADQRAEVWIAADEHSDFALAGIWYLAGSTTSLYSNPPGELDAGERIIQTSGRRWRDDEFLVPRALTEGRSSIRVQLRVVGAPLPLFPGATPTAAAWTELGYRAYSYVL